MTIAKAPSLVEIIPSSKRFSSSPTICEVNGRRVIVRHAVDPTFKGECLIDIYEQYKQLHKAEKALLLLRGQALDYSSDLEDLLKRFLALYYSKNKTELAELTELLRKEEPVASFGKLTFMESRNALSSLLKKNKSLGENNGFTKLLNSIILERNKYAHGRFFFGLPSGKPMLHWLASGAPPIERYGEIDVGMIEGFIDCCLDTYEWLANIKKNV